MTKCKCIDCIGPLARRQEIRHGGVTEEELPHRPRRSKNKRWCKGKEGREHRYEQVLWHSYKYTDSYGIERQVYRYRWICQGCGKISWSAPVPEPPEHTHCFCLTQIETRWRREAIYEQCCICGRHGKSYSFYTQR